MILGAEGWEEEEADKEGMLIEGRRGRWTRGVGVGRKRGGEGEEWKGKATERGAISRAQFSFRRWVPQPLEASSESSSGGKVLESKKEIV